MTDSMVERVARAICHSSLTRDVLALNEPDSTDPGQLAVALAGVLSKEVNKCWGEFEDDARAAIEAMREPTEEMVLGMIGAAYEQSMRDTAPFDGQAIFRGAIDAALAEPVTK